MTYTMTTSASHLLQVNERQTLGGSCLSKPRNKSLLNSAFIGIQMVGLGNSRESIFSASKNPGTFFFNRPLNVDNGFHYLLRDLLEFPLISDSAQSSLIWLCVPTKTRNLDPVCKGPLTCKVPRLSPECAWRAP